jgi:hypothetical protein
LREFQIDQIQLETGRPRTDAYIVYLLLMLRGFNGGCKDRHSGLNWSALPQLKVVRAAPCRVRDPMLCRAGLGSGFASSAPSSSVAGGRNGWFC